MQAEVIVAVIAASGGLLGSLIGIFANTKLVTYRIEQLENKVNKHNNLIDRTYKLEEQFCLQDEKLKVANHRLDDLEKGK